MACCRCCCGGVDCAEGDQGKCCCGGPTGTCCQEGEYCCSGVCQASPCSGGSGDCAGQTYIFIEFDVPHTGDGWDYSNLQFPGFHSSIEFLFNTPIGPPGPFVSGAGYLYPQECTGSNPYVSYSQGQNIFNSRERLFINYNFFSDYGGISTPVTVPLRAHWRDGWPGSGPITISASCGGSYAEVEVTPPTGGVGCPSHVLASVVLRPDRTFTLSTNPLP